MTTSFSFFKNPVWKILSLIGIGFVLIFLASVVKTSTTFDPFIQGMIEGVFVVASISSLLSALYLVMKDGKELKNESNIV